MIADLRALDGTEFENRTDKKLEGKLRSALTATLAGGAGPDGEAWAPRKKEGGRAYAGAASKLRVTSIGPFVKATITGPEVFGHIGARGAPPRPMIPTGGGATPAVVAAAMRESSDEVWAEMTR